MKSNFKHVLTTVLGILIAVFGGVLVWYDKLDGIGSIGYFLVAWALITSKDNLLHDITLHIFKKRQ